MALAEQREYRWMKVNTRRLCRTEVCFSQLDVNGIVIFFFFILKLCNKYIILTWFCFFSLICFLSVCLLECSRKVQKKI